MSYSDDNDLLAELSQEELALLSGDDTGNTIDTDRTAQARMMGDSLINGTLRGRYDNLPLADEPLLKTISIDLAIYYLNEYRYRDSIVPPGAIRRRDSALALLARIGNGEILLKGHKSGTSAPALISSNLKNKENYFDNDSMERFFPG